MTRDPSAISSLHETGGTVTGAGDDPAVIEELLPARADATRQGASPARPAELEAKILRAPQRSEAEATRRRLRVRLASKRSLQ